MRLLLFLFVFVACTAAQPVTNSSQQPSADSRPQVDGGKAGQKLNQESKTGFFDYTWDDEKGEIHLTIPQFDKEFLYVNSLAAGVGSNDIGLDRGQLGSSRVVKFIKSGPKVLLVQLNYDYRAESDNVEESKSVEQAFAQSILWGFKVLEGSGPAKINLTEFLLRDAHGVAARLARGNQGSYRVDKTRSAIYLPGTMNFPKNTEFEATVTFTGSPKGREIRSVTPDGNAVTVRQHHSFVELPDNQYQPRVFDPRSGFNQTAFMDYATPINEHIVKRWINRHRLAKKNPEAAVSEAVEPIIYYVDRGAPEPIKSALIEGASWWNQAFEAAGYKDAFQVYEMPEDAHPLDVRYNVIQWVHRSTRGWSYGASVRDPRTGEIIKGHVSLGSLRVRQDYLIAQGLLAPFKDGGTDDSMLLKLALMRLRQLSAHEVGHTIGLAHNFAASVNDRASVMDYPHPLVKATAEGFSVEDSYDIGIGAWDKRTVLYGYQHFPKGVNEKEALRNILLENEAAGLKYISDADARPAHGSNPHGHLWDNGSDPVAELIRLSSVRQKAIANFGTHAIKDGDPFAMAENVFVPLYLSHRYQVEAVAKIIGGMEYNYAVKGGMHENNVVDDQWQLAAMNALMQTISPEYLAIPDEVLQLISPIPMGYRRDRELFKIRTGNTFDPISAAESAANHSLRFFMNGAKMSRVLEFHARGKSSISVGELLTQAFESIHKSSTTNSFEKQLKFMVEKLYFNHLMQLIKDESSHAQVRSIALSKLSSFSSVLANIRPANDIEKAHYQHLVFDIEKFLGDPIAYKIPTSKPMPDGSPIGCGESAGF